MPDSKAWDLDNLHRGMPSRYTPVTIDIPPDEFVIKCDFHYDPKFFLGTYLYLCGFVYACTKLEHNVEQNCINLHYTRGGPSQNKLGKVTIE